MDSEELKLIASTQTPDGDFEDPEVAERLRAS